MVKPANDETAEAVDIETGEIVEYERAAAITSVTPRITDKQLREVKSYEDAVALAESEYGTLDDISEYLGNGFELLRDKGILVGKPFAFVEWRVNDGDFGYFISAALVTVDGGRYIINDGSTGVARQLAEYTAERKRNGGLKVNRGLRASEYDTCPDCGRPLSKSEPICGTILPNGSECGFSGERRAVGTTYYLETSA